MAVKVLAELLNKVELVKGIYKYTVKAPEIAKDAKAGQFLEIKVSETGEPFLRRPISIYNIDRDSGIVEFIFQVKGRGTELLSQIEVGKSIDIMGPLGFGSYNVKEYKNVAIIGGGIGTYPLYELAKELKGKANINVYLGFRDKSLVTCEKEFEEIGLNKLVVTTDDGSYKEKGFAIDFMKKDIEEHSVDMIFACGPLPMLRAIRQYAIDNNIPCQISLEERMGCGIGACLGCAVKVTSGKEPRFGHVCKEGPVFNASDVEI
jgi:dihydroorotate dehydrogenase electron transfer subunit